MDLSTNGSEDMALLLPQTQDVKKTVENVEEEYLNPELAWNSSYTNRKMNASFSMFKPMA